MRGRSSKLYGGTGGRGGGADRRGQDDANAMEEMQRQQNDRMIDDLAHDVKNARQIALELGTDLDRDRHLMDNVQSQFVRATAGIQHTIGNVQSVMARGGPKQTLIFALVVFALFFAVWWFIK